MVSQSRGVGGRAAVLLGLALLSLALPVAALIPLPGQAPVGAAAAAPNDYRLMVAALFVALLCSIISILGAARVSRRGSRWLVVGVAMGGLILGGYLLLALIGTCGIGVLSGACAP